MSKTEELEAGPGAPQYIVVVAASSGGLNALISLVESLPDDFPAATLVLQHLSPEHSSHLADILQRYTRLRVVPASSGTIIQSRTLYTAIPGKHLAIAADGVLTLTD